MLKNSITLKLFDPYGFQASQTAKLASRARRIRFGSIYPGGFSSISFFVPCDITTPIEITEGCKVLAFNWTIEVWHGFITSIAYVLSSTGETGIEIIGVGAFGYVMGSQRIEKRWADNRLTAEAWKNGAAPGLSDANPDRFTSIDRSKGRLRIETKNASYAALDASSAYYEMPIGDTVKRVKLSYQLQEGAGALVLRMWNVTAAASVWSQSTSGSGVRDDTLGTPSRRIEMTLYAESAHTGVTDGSRFGQIDDAISGANALMVYSELGSINAYEVAKDLVGILTQLSSNTDRISSALTTSVEPFITNGKESAASILQRICSYGDSVSLPIGYAVWGSQETSDEKPQLVVEPFPSIASYDYTIDATDPLVEAPVSIVRDVNGVVNYVCVRYEDNEGRASVVTPDDDASLKDDASIALYGRREADSDINVGLSTQALAILAGKTYLAQKKNPVPYVSGPVRVIEAIRNAQGGETPVSEILAGQRVKLVNIVDDVLLSAGAGATFIITEVEYSDDDQSASISFGVPDSLSSFLAAMSLIPVKNTAAKGA